MRFLKWLMPEWFTSTPKCLLCGDRGDKSRMDNTGAGWLHHVCEDEFSKRIAM